MKPSAESILQYGNGLKPEIVRQHLERLPEDYFTQFSLPVVVEHIALLQELDAGDPAEVLFSRTGEKTATCTVLAYDYPAEFSVISGILAGAGFSIQSGQVFTYARSDTPARTRLRRRRSHRFASSMRRCIVDHFSGHLDERLRSPEAIGELCRRLKEVLGLLSKGDPASMENVKRLVNMAVVAQLEQSQHNQPPVLYPMEVSISAHPDSRIAQLRVVAQDTPAFLYALSNTLTMQHLSIERLRIHTVHGRVEDEIEMVDRAGPGRSLADEAVQNRIRLSVLLTKQFTYFLPAAPDPYAALSRFDQLIGDLMTQSGRQDWLQTVSDPHAMRDLARMLGASDFLWEDFIRLQYESLLPLLQPHVATRQLSTPPERLAERINEALRGCETQSEQIEAVNRFKDRETFLIDLDHILRHDIEFKELSRRLTRLAELVVDHISAAVYQDLKSRYGEPLTVGGLEARYAIMGLGKLGGVSLGYASDIELLFVYSDTGQTAGPDVKTNAEFFSELARETSQAIAAKREGIFEVDLRLRPHGRSGPLACSLESFCTYYGPGGAALSYERLALVRLRYVAGDRGLGERLERVRDEFVYGAREIDLREIHNLRARQAKEKQRPGVYNAKFSPGALVDLEYAVQLLQVQYGGERESLRTPLMHTALAGLRDIGVLAVHEMERLVNAYDFLRILINALRMLRGSARDLFLPEAGSSEFLHLARRMSYEDRDGLSAGEQLHLDYETHTASVRAFVEKHYGRDSIPGQSAGNVADVLLSTDMKQETALQLIHDAGFDNPEQALANLRSLAGRDRQRDVFMSLALLACDHLRMEPAPCMALNNWERYVSGMRDPISHFELLLSQPRRLDILLGIFSRSQFLANTLIQHPGYMNWITDPHTLQGIRDRSALESEVAELARTLEDREGWVAAICRFRKREILRIGTRDMILRVPVEEITRDLSVLAEVILDAALLHARDRMLADGRIPAGRSDLLDRFYLLALGKLGGEELNYSSDIDLVAGVELAAGSGEGSGAERGLLRKLLDELRGDLTCHTVDGFAYRLDFRLRPYGVSGEWVQTSSAMLDYYQNRASLWEIQALLKARPVAGNQEAGRAFVNQLEPLFLQGRPVEQIIHSIRHMRDTAVQHVARSDEQDVKTGIGGIRDIEFLVQGLQLAFSEQYPDLLGGNTLQVLRRICSRELLSHEACGRLEDHYLFLRRVEHYLQILEDRQVHALPADEEELGRLARRLLGVSATAAMLEEELNRRTEDVRRLYDEEFNRLRSSNM